MPSSPGTAKKTNVSLFPDWRFGALVLLESPVVKITHEITERLQEKKKRFPAVLTRFSRSENEGNKSASLGLTCHQRLFLDYLQA